MPAYNEARQIRESLERTHRQLSKMTPDFQIVAVDDGSQDNTEKIMREVASQLEHITVVKLLPNRGKGEALRQGFYHSTGELIYFLDADTDLPPEQIGTLWEVMNEEKSEIVIGCKMHPLSKVLYPSHRRLISLVYFTITRMLFGLPVRDTQTGLKLFQRKVLENVMPRMLVKAFAYDLELLVIADHLGYRIAEAPVIIEHHLKYGAIPPKAIWVTANDTLAIFYRLYILNYYDHPQEKPSSFI